MDISPTLLLLGLTNREGALLASSLPLHQVEIGELVAFGLPVDPEETLKAPGGRLLLRYHKAIQSIWTRCGLVPFRFGHRTYSAQGLQQRLQGEEDHWREVLEKIGPCGELSLSRSLVQSIPAEEPPDDTGTGRSFLERRRRELEKKGSLSSPAIETAVTNLLTTLDGFPILDYRRMIKPCGDHHISVELVVLLEREELERALRHASELGDAELKLSGPWAPFSFS